MLKPSDFHKSWSELGLRVLIVSVFVTAILSVLDGLIRGPYAAVRTSADPAMVTMFSVWISDFRYLFEQGVYAATVFFVGAKFFETRTIVTVGFDKIDATKMVFRGVDEENVVWIGRRYGTRLEAEAVAQAIAERMKESAEPADLSR
jgi:hypothetical protein